MLTTLARSTRRWRKCKWRAKGWGHQRLAAPKAAFGEHFPGGQARSCLFCMHFCRMEGNEAFYKEWNESFDAFDDMGLHENLLRGIFAYGALAVRECTVLARHQCGTTWTPELCPPRNCMVAGASSGDSATAWNVASGRLRTRPLGDTRAGRALPPAGPTVSGCWNGSGRESAVGVGTLLGRHRALGSRAGADCGSVTALVSQRHGIFGGIDC